MATLEITFLQGQLEERKRRLEQAISLTPRSSGLASLLHEVDSALQRMGDGSYGICEECHGTIEKDRLLADPLCRYCLDHLTPPQRAALQRDLDLAAEVQRGLLPQAELRAGNWQTSYHYAPHGPVSGDYFDLIPFDGKLFFVLGDVSGKGVAAAMLMTQLHALFRSLTGLGLPLCQIIAQANRVLCESALAGQYATLVCGQASSDGEVEIHNAGHLPALIAKGGGMHQVESMGFPLGMFLEGEFPACRHTLATGDMLFLYSDGLSEARCADDEYGVDRVITLVQGHAGRHTADLIAACLSDLHTFTNGEPQFDDLSVLAIQRC